MLKNLLYSVTLIFLPYGAECQQFLDVSGQAAIKHSAEDDFLRMVGGGLVLMLKLLILA